ncbi:MAG: DUF3300 domain-containing protein [Syntrophobacteraceae bacterium]
MNPGKVFGYALCWLVVVLMAPPLGASAAGPGDDQPFKQEQLDQMLAPIALYPDSLLAQVLMASTYPLEVVQADRWVRQNSKLKGETLYTALDKMEWDPSIKALVPFPEVLSMMSEQLDWTQQLGDAFLGQQGDVMDTVQKLRARAHAQNNLKSTREQQVIVEEKVIRIEPVNPEVVYIPAYNPVVVYGPWLYPAYPPYYWGPAFVGAGVAFAAGVAVGAAWGHGWGNWNWGNHTINVNVNRNINVNHNLKAGGVQTGKWQHNPDHRKGVAYRNDAAGRQYGQKRPGSPDAGRDYRGHSQAPGGQGMHQTGYREPGRQPTAGDRAGRGGEMGRPQGAGSMGGGQTRPGAFDGMSHGGEAREHADRGFMSRSGGMQGGGEFHGGGGGFHGGGGGMHGGGGGFHGRR